MNTIKAGAAALALSAVAQNNLVDVNIRNVQVDLKGLLHVEDNIVQVPIGIAASACPNVKAAVLAGEICTADNATRALAQAAELQSM